MTINNGTLMWFAPSDSNHVKLTSFMLIKSKLTSFLLSLYMFPTLTNSLFMMVSRVLFTNIAIFYNTFGRKLFFSNPKRIKKKIYPRCLENCAWIWLYIEPSFKNAKYLFLKNFKLIWNWLYVIHHNASNYFRWCLNWRTHMFQENNKE